MQNQKGFAAPLIVIIVAAFALGLLGPVVYPRLKLQVEQITAPKTENETTEEASSSGDHVQSVPDQTQSSQSSLENTPGAETDAAVEENTPAEEDEEQKAQETGAKDEEEQAQGQEGVVDEPPLNLTFRVLDFSKLSNLLSSIPAPSPTPMSTSFISSYIGKVKVFTNLLSSPSPTPTPVPTPAPGPKKAIVITLDTVKIHDDKDPVLNGEVQIVSSVRTGFTEQVSAWPYKNWDEANNGDTLKINQPIFVLPRDSIDEKIAIWISVVDNDSLPSSATGLIRKAYDISSGSNLIYNDPTQILRNELYNQTIGRFLNWLGGEEHIGTHATILLKAFDYGLNHESKKTYTVRKGDATFTYTVREVTIPDKPLRVDVKLNKIKTGESGDYDLAGGEGDLYVWTFVSDGFREKEMNAATMRIPASGEHDVADHSSWGVNKEILSATVSGPILYYQIGVWDADSGNNDDQLEIVSDTLYMSDYKAGDVIKTSKDGDDGVDASATIEREIRFYVAN